MVVNSRIVGVFKMTDETGGDDKLLCVIDDVRFDDCKELEDISQFTLDEIEHFFVHYKGLEPGKEVKGSGWGSREEAEQILEAALKSYEAEGHNEKEDVAERTDAEAKN